MKRHSIFSVVAACVIAAFVTPSFAQSPLQQRIEDSLKQDKPATRGLGGTRSISVDPKAAAERSVLDRARSRSISIEAVAPASKEEREAIAEVIKDKPKIDLEIYFDYNSDVVGPKAIAAINSLGEVLIKPNFKGGTFILNGHTDAAGSPDYNLQLSHRRAQSVRRYLIEKYRIDPGSLIATGFGKEQLKIVKNPLADENRRVQIVNASQ